MKQFFLLFISFFIISLTAYSQSTNLPHFLLAKAYKTSLTGNDGISTEMKQTPMVWVDGQIFKIYYEDGDWEVFEFLDKRTIHSMDNGVLWQHTIQDQESGDIIVFHLYKVDDYPNLRMISLRAGENSTLLMECEVLNYNKY
ncbi:MAG: hypothetical protein HQ521_20095 [Bacteroidetes bacterium]|nr:hypothetical protein [Bacteroidota bacterium]